ncbi:MAG: DUF1080 domain-containing protein [Roseibacillus sp.]|nr:DUF1080 domain-containing protein [Roseibacillus sp.]
MKLPFIFLAFLPFLATGTPENPVSSIEPSFGADTATLLQDGYISLFDGRTLAGWRKAGGTAKYKVADGAIVGHGKNIRGNTFLCTNETYRDFILTFQFQFVDRSGNSGCQFRSQQRNKTGRVFGYQCEHDNNDKRSYTAGIYEEARRGWLFPGKFTTGDTATTFSIRGRELFRWKDWNTIVIKCDGRRIQTWLNGVSRADFEDKDDDHFTPEGFIALQVHGGKSAHVKWRRLYLRKL